MLDNLIESTRALLENSAIPACEYLESQLGKNLYCQVLESDRVFVICGVATMSLALYSTKRLLDKCGICFTRQDPIEKGKRSKIFKFSHRTFIRLGREAFNGRHIVCGGESEIRLHGREEGVEDKEYVFRKLNKNGVEYNRWHSAIASKKLEGLRIICDFKNSIDENHRDLFDFPEECFKLKVLDIVTNNISNHYLDSLADLDKMNLRTNFPVQLVTIHKQCERDLVDYYKEFYPQITLHNRMCFIREIITAVSLLHSKGIVHLDIKLENILCYKNAKGELHIKICDFDYSRRYSAETLEKNNAGTADCAPLEVFEESKCKLDRQDVYCCGLVLYSILTSELRRIRKVKGGMLTYLRNSFNDELTGNHHLESLLNCEEIELFPKPDLWKQLIKDMTWVDWKRRISMEEALVRLNAIES